MAYYSDMVNRRTCVYRAFDAEGRLLYVGLSMNPRARLEKHRRAAWWPLAADITVEWFDGREAAKAVERSVIATLNPPYNVARPAPGPRICEVN